MSPTDKPQKRRRGHGEGSISQRADGRWMGRVDLGYQGGKRKVKTIYGKTRKEVADKLRILIQQQRQGVNIAPERQTVEAFLLRWLDEVVRPTKRPGTLDIYTAAVRRMLPHIGSTQLQKLTVQQVQAMLSALLREGYAPATVDRARDVLINALNVAQRWELVPRNVAALTEPIKVDAYTPHVYSPLQAQQFLQAAAGDALEAAYWLGLSGLRRGEVLGLRWQDINLSASEIRVQWSLESIRRERLSDAERAARGILQLTDTLALSRTKTDESQRVVYLSPGLTALLEEHQRRQSMLREALSTTWKDFNLVFCTGKGTPIAPRNFLRSRQDLLKRAGLPQVRFHDLRHSFVSLLVAAGVPLKVVQELAGHSDPRITQQIYTHVSEDQKRDAATTLDMLLRRTVKEVN